MKCLIMKHITIYILSLVGTQDNRILQKMGFSGDTIIAKFKAESRVFITACLMHIMKKEDQMEILYLFEELKREHFTLVRYSLTPNIEKLIVCNLLFYNSQNNAKDCVLK